MKIRGAINYKRKDIILISIVIGLCEIAFNYLASEYFSNSFVTASLY